MAKSSDLENMKKMHETYTSHTFPQDTASTAFSSTSIYFRPRTESAPPAAQPPSPEVSRNNKNDQAQEYAGIDTASKKNSATHVSADLSTDKSRDESKIPDECADDKHGDGMPGEAKGPKLEGTTAKDKPNKEQDIPPEEK